MPVTPGRPASPHQKGSPTGECPHLQRLLELLPIASTSALVEAATDARHCDDVDLPTLYDAVLAAAAAHVEARPSAQRAAVRLELNCRLNLLVVELRALQRPRPTARALLCGAGPTPAMVMTIHTIESCGYAVVPVPLRDLAALADLARIWGDVRHLAVDASLLTAEQTRRPILDAITRLQQQSPVTAVMLLTGSAVLAGPMPFTVPGARLVSTMVAVATTVGGHLRNPLSAQEVRVLELVSRGATNARIAKELAVSVGAVKADLERVHEKLETVDRASAVAVALRRGWIT